MRDQAASPTVVWFGDAKQILEHRQRVIDFLCRRAVERIGQIDWLLLGQLQRDVERLVPKPAVMRAGVAHGARQQGRADVSPVFAAVFTCGRRAGLSVAVLRPGRCAP